MKRPTEPDAILLAAAADESRLAIIRQLSAEGSICACDLTDCCGVSQPTVSHHLKVLREAGWVRTERRGSFIWYSIDPSAIARLGAIVSGIERAQTPQRRLPVIDAPPTHPVPAATG